MTKRLIDIDDNLLRIAQEHLETETMKDTVNGALEWIARAAAALEYVESFSSPQFADLRDPEIMAEAWR